MKETDMTTTATTYIGGEKYELQPLVFRQMKQIWPLLQSHMTAPTVPLGEATIEGIAASVANEMKAAEDAIKMIAIAMRDPEKDADWIEDHLRADEIPLLQQTIMKLLEISGMTSGNAEAELDKMTSQFLESGQSVSMETSTD